VSKTNKFGVLLGEDVIMPSSLVFKSSDIAATFD